MDHHLEDTLNLDTEMGSMDFDHSGVVVSQEDITLETAHEDDIPMEFEHIEEQPILMDTGNEEIIVSDFMGDQFGLQEYSVQDEETPESSGTIDTSQLVLTSQSNSMIDLQFEPETITTEVAKDIAQPKYISVKAAVAPRGKKVESTTTSVPRQVAIAPKPPKLVTTGNKPAFVPGKQYAIAPKPVTFSNKSVVKKLVTGVIQGGNKTGNVLTQIGKQLVMVPASGGQKIKLVTAAGGIPSMQYVRANNDQAQLIKNVGGAQKQVLAKVIVQGQNVEASGQPAVITKLLPTGAPQQTRYVMQQKTMPISFGGKVLMASPTKQGVRFAKKQIIQIKSPATKMLAPATTVTSQSTAGKKVVISTNSNQNVILKTTAPSKNSQVSKDGNVVVQTQRSQLHQINVPGKGIQYIRLITNPSPATQKANTLAAPTEPATNKNDTKSWVLDAKGNLIEVQNNCQPPPLVFSRNVVSANAKVTSKATKKLVRLTPIAAKPQSTTLPQQSSRSSQSLLAPLPSMDEAVLEEIPEPLEEQSIHDGDTEEEVTIDREVEHQVVDSKAALQALIQETEANSLQKTLQTHEVISKVEIEFEPEQVQQEEDSLNGLEDYHQTSNRSNEHPLIVIPSHYEKQNRTRMDSDSRSTDDRNYPNMNIEVEGMPYHSPKASLLSEADQLSRSVDLGLRPRKPCNCTKSQCLKLYCDCFANGEFCNRCNCNNCHNNLENEELRQKAIRTCLERNPNAFRPKIGKAKNTGPDIIRRHNKGCNCKRSGCLKNYCECYEAKIACTAMCKCVGCRNVEETLERRRDAARARDAPDPCAAPPAHAHSRQPCSLMTSEVIEAVCQCLVAAGGAGGAGGASDAPADPVAAVIDEFARCLQDIVGASHHAG